MRWHHLITALAVVWLCMPSAAWPILLETGPNKARVGGFVVRDDGKTLVIRVLLADGKEKELEYDRTKVKITILHQLNKDRLKKLTKDDPKAYRDYAEELADKKFSDDPEAKAMARRLFLIAAHLDPQQYGTSSLLSMSSLADTPVEADKCRAMAFLLDPKSDASALKRKAAKPAPIPNDQAGALKNLQKALQYYRTGEVAKARTIVNGPGMDKVFGIVPGMMEKNAFLQRCTDVGSADNPNLPDDAMRVVLRAELWIIDQLAGGGGAGDKKASGEAKWSSVLQERQFSPVSPLNLKSLTEFDPQKCLYRENKWVEP